MASLFNSVNNHLFITLCEVINAVQSGEVLTRSQLIARLKSDDFNYEYAADTNTEEMLADYFFTFDPDSGQAECRLLDEIPYFLTTDEKHWIVNLLQDKQFSFLLSSSLREKLNSQFATETAPDLSAYWVRMQRNAGAPVAVDKQDFLKTVFSALRSNKNIVCTYTETPSNKEITITGSPCRLEYDLAKNAYTLLLWSEHKLIKIPLSSVSAVTLHSSAKPEDIEPKLQAYLKEHVTKVTLAVQEKNNAVERCFAMFSSFDKDSWRDDDGKYILEVSYYDFDYPEIRKNILSLGSAVKVLKPEPIAADILNELKEMFANYSEL